MLEALDHESLLKVAKKGFMPRALQLANLIATANIGPGGTHSYFYMKLE